MRKFKFNINAFPKNKVKSDQLHKEITKNSHIIKNVLGVHSKRSDADADDDTVEVEFDTDLTATEEQELNNLVGLHIPTPRVSKFFNISPLSVKTKSKNYRLVSRFSYPGTDVAGEIIRIKTLSYKDNGVGSYNVRVRVVPSYKIVSEATFSNNQTILNDVGTISNIPDTECMLEVDIKQNTGGGEVYINDIVIYHG